MPSARDPRDEHDAPTIARAPNLANASRDDDESEHTLQLANEIAERVQRGRRGSIETGDTIATLKERGGRDDVGSEPAVVAHVDSALPATEGDDFELRYPMRRVLGVGGMGEVQLRHDQRIGRDVAVKVARGELLDDVTRGRFVREARIQGQLEHPSVVPVYDVARTGDGKLFFTMKRVRGRTLEEVLSGLRAGDADTRARYSQRRLLTSFVSVCLAIDFAHARGVLHRDLKPANIMFGDFGEVHVLDWGIAKLADEDQLVTTVKGPTKPDEAEHGQVTSAWDAGRVRDAKNAPAQTIDGALVGTPGYMPPEQAQGRLDRVDVRSDVYSLGVMLFEILAGQPMHRGRSMVQVLVSTLEGRNRVPSAVDPSVSPELDAICLRATAMERGERFQTARALSEALERYLDGDRDATLRREHADRHLANARELAARARDPKTPDAQADAERLEAVRETSRALAFRPEHEEARALLATLLLEPPRSVPAEVEAEYEALEVATRRVGAGSGAVRHFTWLVLAPFLLWMGVRWPGTAAAGLSCAVGAGALGLWMQRTGNVSAAWGGLMLTLSIFALVAMSLLFGPFVMVPALAAINATFYSMYTTGRQRAGVTVLCALAMLVPLGLEYAGVLPPSMAFENGRMILLPRLVNLPETAVRTFLLFGNLALVILVGVHVGRVRDTLRKTEHKLVLQSWQLRQLLPREKRPAEGDTAKLPRVQPPAKIS